MQHRPYL